LYIIFRNVLDADEVSRGELFHGANLMILCRKYMGSYALSMPVFFTHG
jgi:hypothetical protein